MSFTYDSFFLVCRPHLSENLLNYATLSTTRWKGGREVECAGLEIRYTVIPYRGFASLPFRHRLVDTLKQASLGKLFSFSIPLFFAKRLLSLPPYRLASLLKNKILNKTALPRWQFQRHEKQHYVYEIRFNINKK